MNEDVLHQERTTNWRQTSSTRIAGPDEAAEIIDELSIVTVYPVSPEVPNLYQAFVGDPNAKSDSGHSTPSGEVYSWRWVLGRRRAGFYGGVVRGKPTFVCWSLLPPLLRAHDDLRSPTELYDAGQLSANALRIAEALEGEGGVLTTGELRRAAGFPTGKAERSAYLKAVQELDSRLLVAKEFTTENDDMGHALVTSLYPDVVAAARELSLDEAIRAILDAYLPHARYILPQVLARHLRIAHRDLDRNLSRLVAEGGAKNTTLGGNKQVCAVSLVPYERRIQRVASPPIK